MVLKKKKSSPKKTKNNIKSDVLDFTNIAANKNKNFSRSVLLKRPSINSGYVPSEDEPFMNRKQLAYFKNKLLDWREELLKETFQTLSNLQETSISEPDLADRASAESDRSLELRARDRERKLVSKIDEALIRIEDGSYGFCIETDEPIGLKRLQARPIATLSLEAQERHERRERVYRDD
tara:strand:+ start:263 stop:802 length:540 start_codon:yes stop_codon:yes gene_type:complete